MSDARLVLRRHSMVIAMAVAPDAASVALGWYEHPRTGVELVETETDRTLWTTSWPYSTADFIHGVAFRRDGARIWVAMSDGRLRCYAAADGVLLRETAATCASVRSVILARDASYAVARGTVERNPTGWYAVASSEDEVTELIEAEGPSPPADTAACIANVVASAPGPNTLLRFGGEAPLAYSHDGKLELFGHADESAPRVWVRARDDSRRVIDAMELPPHEVPLSGAFDDTGRRYFVGTRAGRIYGGALEGA